MHDEHSLRLMVVNYKRNNNFAIKQLQTEGTLIRSSVYYYKKIYNILFLDPNLHI